jgi:hypothetical protein
MNLAMRLTFDGLVRALRMRAQRLADDIEFSGATEAAEGNMAKARGNGLPATRTGGGDDDGGRG